MKNLFSFFPSALAEYADNASVSNDPSPWLALFQLFAPYLIVALIFGILCHVLAKKKGYSGYFWTGFFLSVIGAIYVAALPVANPASAPDSASLSPDDRKLLSSFHRLSDEDKKSILSHIHSFTIDK